MDQSNAAVTDEEFSEAAQDAAELSHEDEDTQDEAANDDEAPTFLEQLLKANLPELEAQCKSRLASINDVEDARAKLNAKNQSAREWFESQGISKKALDAARKVKKMQESDRNGFFLAFFLLLKAEGIQVNPEEYQAIQLKLFS